MFNDIIKSSKALEMLQRSMSAGNSRREKQLSGIEHHLIEQAEHFLSEQMEQTQRALSNVKRVR